MNVCSIYYNKQRDEFKIEEGDFDFRVMNNEEIYKIIPPELVKKYKQAGGTYYNKLKNQKVIYKIDFPTDEDVIQLYYDNEDNLFIDCDGENVYNIFCYISPSDLQLFKLRKKSMAIRRRGGGIVELMYHNTSNYES